MDGEGRRLAEYNYTFYWGCFRVKKRKYSYNLLFFHPAPACNLLKSIHTITSLHSTRNVSYIPAKIVTYTLLHL